MNRSLALTSASTGIGPTSIRGITVFIITRVHEIQRVQLAWVALTAEFRDYLILVMCAARMGCCHGGIP